MGRSLLWVSRKSCEHITNRDQSLGGRTWIDSKRGAELLELEIESEEVERYRRTALGAGYIRQPCTHALNSAEILRCYLTEVMLGVVASLYHLADLLLQLSSTLESKVGLESSIYNLKELDNS